MQFLIGLAVILCLLLSETGPSTPVEDLWLQVGSILFLTFSVPLLALFQTLFLIRVREFESLPPDTKEATLKRLGVCHTAVWLVASLMTAGFVDWQRIVRENMGLGRIPVVDDLLILVPVLFSLVFSWAIFYELQSVSRKSASRNPENSDPRPPRDRGWRNFWSHLADRRRAAFVGIRVRVYLLLALVPAVLLIFLRDFSNPELVSPQVTFAAFVLALLVVVPGYPWIVRRIWKTRLVDDRDLAGELEAISETSALRLHSIRIWDTGDQIVNAMVVGSVPWLRMILLTDTLVRVFPRQELLAIVRHEAAHIRLRHLQKRLMAVLAPLVLCGLLELAGCNVRQAMEGLLANVAPAPVRMIAPFLLFGLYAAAVTMLLSRRMEFEADKYAAGGSTENANSLLGALNRLAALQPPGSGKGLFHPSLQQRITRIESQLQSQLDLQSPGVPGVLQTK